MADVKILHGLLQKSPQQLGITADVYRMMVEQMLTRVLAVPDPVASASLIVQLLQTALRQVSSPDDAAGRRVILAFVRSEREPHHAAVISALAAAPELAAGCLLRPQGGLSGPGLSGPGITAASELLDLIQKEFHGACVENSLWTQSAAGCAEALVQWASAVGNAPRLGDGGVVAMVALLLRFPEVRGRVMTAPSKLPTLLHQTVVAAEVNPADTVLYGAAEAVGELLAESWPGAGGKIELIRTFIQLTKTGFGQWPLAVAPFIRRLPHKVMDSGTATFATMATLDDTMLENVTLGMIRWLWWPAPQSPANSRHNLWPVKMIEQLSSAKRTSVLAQVAFKAARPLVEMIESRPACRFMGMSMMHALLLGYQDSPKVFHMIAASTMKLLATLRHEEIILLQPGAKPGPSRSSKTTLQLMSRLLHQLIHVHTGFPEIYSPLLKAIEGLPVPSAQELDALPLKAWSVPAEVSVRFTWEGGGNQVSLGGLSKSGWTKTGWRPMVRDGNAFIVTVKLKPGVYQYKYLVDDEWRHDGSKPMANSAVGTINNTIEVASFHSYSVMPSSAVAGRPGLNNLGNTCYLNSVVQALFSVTPFCNAILSSSNPDATPYFREWHELFAFMKFSEKQAVLPSRFVQNCRPSWFVAGNQQDSTEFLLYAFDQLEVECKRKRESHAGPEDVPCPTTVFEGKFTTISKCSKCNCSSRRTDAFNTVPLAFSDDPAQGQADKVEAMLDRYLYSEALTGSDRYQCDTCGLQEGSRQFEFEELPECLILTLMRFAYDRKSQSRRKIMRPVDLPPTITVPYSADGEVRSKIFKLNAIVIHSGTGMNSGHYYSFAAAKPSPEDPAQWFLYNDSAVSQQGSLRSILDMASRFKQDTPYMLFYREDGAPDAEHQPTISVSLKARIEADNRLAQKDNEGRERKRKSNELAKALPNNNNTNRRDDEPPPGGPSFTPNYIS